VLEQHEGAWAEALQALLRDAEAALRRVRSRVDGPEKELVVADFEDERERIQRTLASLSPDAEVRGDRVEEPDEEHAPAPDPPDEPGDRSPAPRPDPPTEEAADPPAPRTRRRSREAPREVRHREPRKAEGASTRTRARATSRDGEPRSEAADRPDRDTSAGPPTGTPQLQLSWSGGKVVAWSGGHAAAAETADQVLVRLEAAGADPAAWTPHDAVPLPDGRKAEAVGAPVRLTLGWLVSLGGTAGDETLGASVTWLGLVAALGARVVAQGRMIPQLDRDGQSGANGKGGGSGQAGGSGKSGRARFSVRWLPALVDADELTPLVKSMPGAVSVFQGRPDRRAMALEILGAFVDAICTDAAARVEVPAAPPEPRNAVDVAEAVLGRLDGTSFPAPHQHGSEIRRGLQRWANQVVGAPKLRLVVQLGPPDDSGAWHLEVLVPGGKKGVEQVDAAMSNASPDRREVIKSELERLERLFPRLQPTSGRRRGEVLLGQDEAWELMATTGAILVNAGFDVRVPPLSRRKAKPALRITATEGHETVVGAQQLSTVRWSAVFDDVELSADDITRLAAESRPLVKSHGRWIEVDHADLEAAAAALAERADRDQLTGADMLRHALGLEESPLRGGVSVAGDGWAADLLRSAGEVPAQPPTSPDGFEGELRGYQADALAWLEFLDNAGLGGCLALDMGLGKTPTMLAHLLATTGHGPALVIAPPAVVGNWASEAQRFAPGLRVVVHHGAGRAGRADIADEVAAADLIITTYGTAVRDIDELADMSWGKVVLDEAQVIKNPASETAQQLRRLEARTRVVLTGTPIENGLGDLWALLDFVNPGLVGERATFVAQLSKDRNGEGGAEQALRTLNGVMVFRRTKAEPAIAAELPDRIDELDHCPMTAEQVGLYQAVLDELVITSADEDRTQKKGAVLAAITALKQICNHPAAYTGDDEPLDGRSGKLARLNEIVDNVFASGERVLIFTHFATWGQRLAEHLTARTGVPVACYHGGLARGPRDRMIRQFQEGEGAGALVLSLKAGGTGLNLTAASHVVLYDRWWNPAVEDQARDRAWRIGQTKTVVAHRLVCPGTVDERVEEVVASKRRIADITLPKSSSIGDLDAGQLKAALGFDDDALLTYEDADTHPQEART
jgi:hypothetical protein